MDDPTATGSPAEYADGRGHEGEKGPAVRVPVWLKMAVAVAVPLVAVAVLAVFQVAQARDRAQQVEEETSIAAVALAPGGLFDALIIERGDAAATVTGVRDGTGLPTEDFADSGRQTDAAIERLREAVGSGGPRVEAAYRGAFESFEALAEVRATTAAHTEDAGFGNMGLAHEIYVDYTVIIDELSAAGGQLGAEITDRDLRAAAGVLDNVNQLNGSVSDVTYNVSIAATIGGLDDLDARDDVVLLVNEYRRALEQLRAAPGDSWADEVEAFTGFEAYDQVLSMSEGALAEEPLDVTTFVNLLPRIEDRENPPLGTAEAIASAADDALQNRIDRLRSDAAAEQQRYLIMAIAVVLGATLLAAFVARSITKPMMSLAKQAHEMASKGLPTAVQQVLETPPGTAVVTPEMTPVQVSSRDETQVVAGALNEVQLSAVDLAVQQATLRQQTSDSLVNLGRRTQNLIGLQLELISELEHDEADAAALAHLYRLDHLATRARRNAESLVVLAGTEPPPNDGRPTSMFDVVRAALSEVEDYQRVQVAQLDESHVSGGLAVDLVHLLAELVENGVLFSPPTEPVDVSGTLDEHGYRVSVTDRGIGMTAVQIGEANQRLSETRTFTAAPSRHLGHHVAGRLAARIGVRVWVAPGDPGGTVAHVQVPLERLTVGPQLDPSVGSAVDGVASAAPSADEDTGHRGPPVFDDLDLGEYRVDGRPPEAPGSVQPAEPETTAAGLTRRVKGSHGPGEHTAIQPIRPPSSDTREAAQDPVRPATSRRADDVAAMLSSFTGGVQRGREDAEAARSDEREPSEAESTDRIVEEERT